MLPILFSDTGATSQDGSHSAIFRMQGPEGCDLQVQSGRTGTMHLLTGELEVLALGVFL